MAHSLTVRRARHVLNGLCAPQVTHAERPHIHALLLENDLSTAIEVTSQLCALGVTDVEIASTVERAHVLLQTQSPSLALVEVHLGRGRTCAEAVQVMTRRRIPFVYLTGLPGPEALPRLLPGAPVLTKPCTLTDLRRAIVAFGLDRAAKPQG